MSSYHFSRITAQLSGVRSVPARHGQILAARAYCPACQPEGARPGRQPALSIASTADGVFLAHCFKGCEPTEIFAAVGLGVADLFPQACSTSGRPITPRAPESWASAAALADAVCDAVVELLVAEGDARIDAASAAARAARGFQDAAREAMRQERQETRKGRRVAK